MMPPPIPEPFRALIQEEFESRRSCISLVIFITSPWVAHGILDAWSGSTDIEARRERGRRGGERGHWDPQPIQATTKMALLLPSVFLSAFLSTQLTFLYSSLSSRAHVRSFYTQTTLLTAVRHGSSQSTAACSATRCKLVSRLCLHEKPALSSRILQCTIREG